MIRPLNFHIARLILIVTGFSMRLKGKVEAYVVCFQQHCNNLVIFHREYTFVAVKRIRVTLATISPGKHSNDFGHISNVIDYTLCPSRFDNLFGYANFSDIRISIKIYF